MIDLAWLAATGVMLLVAGLAALAYDTVRRRKGNSPFPFPDTTTRLLDATISPSAPQIRSTPSNPRPRRLRSLSSAVRRPHGLLSAPKGRSRVWSRRLVVLALLSGGALVIALSTLGYTSLSERQAAPEGSVIAGICRFQGAARQAGPDEFLESELLKAAAATGLSNLVLKTSSRTCTSDQEAVAERSHLEADFLFWGQVGNSGEITAYVIIAPDFTIRQAGWQRWSVRDVSALVLPPSSEVTLPAATGVYPLVPLALSLGALRQGDYSLAARSAKGASAALEGNGGSAPLALVLEAAARAATADYVDIDRLLSGLDGRSASTIAAEARLTRAYVRFQLADYSGAISDLDAALADRSASDRTQARSHLLRARAHYLLAGDGDAALAGIDESLRLDPSYLPARLRRAEVLYRLSQPDAARTELELLLKHMPEAAPAHRLMGLVWLMLGKEEEAKRAFAAAQSIFGRWIAGLRAEEARAQAEGDRPAAQAATAGIVLLNREMASVYLYQGMALAGQARKEPPESFLGGLWRRLRGQPTTYERALAALQEASRSDPRRTEILLQMGTVYADSGDPGKAAETFRQAQDINPTTEEPYLALARLQSEQGNPGEAAQTLEELLAKAPRSYRAYEMLYQIYADADNRENAEAILARATAFPAANTAEHLWRGKFLRLSGKLDDAALELQAAASTPSLWEAHLLLGQIAQERGSAAQALDHYNAVLARQPNDPTALLNSGRLLMLAGKRDEAEKLLARLTTLSPGDVEGHIAYSELLIGKGELDRAVAEAQRATELEPTRADAYFHLGLAHEARRDWPKASDSFKAATERDPAHFEALIRLAGSRFHEDKYPESLQACEAAIRMRPDDPQAHRWKAEAQLALRDPEAALASAQQALSLAPGMPEALIVAARAYALMSDMSRAESFAREAAAAEPRNPRGLVALGEVLLDWGSAQRALDTFREAATLSPTSAQVATGFGRAYDALGEHQKALDSYRQAFEADGQHADAHLFAGHTYVKLGRWEEAFHEYSRAVQLRPNWPEALYYLGTAQLQRKDLFGAQTSFKKATERSPNLVQAWYGLGIATRDRGQREEAIAALRRAVELNADFAEAWLYLALTLEESGDHTQATQAFAQAEATASDPAIRQQAQQGIARLR